MKKSTDYGVEGLTFTTRGGKCDTCGEGVGRGVVSVVHLHTTVHVRLGFSHVGGWICPPQKILPVHYTF